MRKTISLAICILMVLLSIIIAPAAAQSSQNTPAGQQAQSPPSYTTGTSAVFEFKDGTASSNLYYRFDAQAGWQWSSDKQAWKSVTNSAGVGNERDMSFLGGSLTISTTDRQGNPAQRTIGFNQQNAHNFEEGMRQLLLRTGANQEGGYFYNTALIIEGDQRVIINHDEVDTIGSIEGYARVSKGTLATSTAGKPEQPLGQAQQLQAEFVGQGGVLNPVPNNVGLKDMYTESTLFLKVGDNTYELERKDGQYYYKGTQQPAYVYGGETVYTSKPQGQTIQAPNSAPQPRRGEPQSPGASQPLSPAALQSANAYNQRSDTQQHRDNFKKYLTTPAAQGGAGLSEQDANAVLGDPNRIAQYQAQLGATADGKIGSDTGTKANSKLSGGGTTPGKDIGAVSPTADASLITSDSPSLQGKTINYQGKPQEVTSDKTENGVRTITLKDGTKITIGQGQIFNLQEGKPYELRGAGVLGAPGAGVPPRGPGAAVVQPQTEFYRRNADNTLSKVSIYPPDPITGTQKVVVGGTEYNVKSNLLQGAKLDQWDGHILDGAFLNIPTNDGGFRAIYDPTGNYYQDDYYDPSGKVRLKSRGTEITASGQKIRETTNPDDPTNSQLSVIETSNDGRESSTTVFKKGAADSRLVTRIESLSITTPDGTSTMQGFDLSTISSNQDVLKNVLREAASIGIQNLGPPQNGKIGAGDNYLLLGEDHFFTIEDGNVKRKTRDDNHIIDYNGDVDPSTISRGEPVLSGESVAREYIRAPDGTLTLNRVQVRLKGDDNAMATYTFNTDAAGNKVMDIGIIMQDGRSVSYRVRDNGQQHRNPRSPYHNALQISDSVYAKDGKLYRDVGGRLVEMTAAETQREGLPSQQLEDMKRALEAEAEVDNRLTANQEGHQQLIVEWNALAQQAISTGNFYIYFMGKAGLGVQARDAMQWWTDRLEESSVGWIAQTDLIRESVCNVIDKYTGRDTRLPGTDEGNYFAVTPEGFIKAGAFINPTKQIIEIPNPSDPEKPITKYNYIIDFKVNLDIPKDPTAAYQDPQIRDKVGVNLAVREKGQENLFPTYLLKDPVDPNKKFVEVQRGTSYYYQDKDEKHLGPIIIAESTKNFEEACIIFDKRPFFSVGLPDTNLRRFGLYAACSPFKIVGGEARTVEQATQELLKTKKELQEESQRTSPGAAVANEDASLY